MPQDRRPDPDALLAQMREQERRAARGRLRIYFGASAGAGKTYAMLEEALKLQGEGRAPLVGIIETHGRRETARLLELKGHVVSRSGDHLCIGLPFHLMGLEIPGTIADAAAGRPVSDPSSERTTMIARAAVDLPAGTSLRVAGHHHEIAGTTPALVAADAADAGLVPYYLLGGTRVRRGVTAGAPLHFDDVEGIDPLLLDLAALDRTTDSVLATEGVS